MPVNVSMRSISPSEIPILLTIFNRPELTKAVVASLREVKPTKLFVAADGPRRRHPQDIINCLRSKEAAVAVDWDCHIETRFLNQNVGCDVAVPSAIDWFFEKEKFGVILEDDCVIHPHFFLFCAEILGRHNDDQRIMQISSLSPYTEREHPYDYHFSRAFRCSGGWATWRRAWAYYNWNIDRTGEGEVWKMITAYYPEYANSQRWYKQFLALKKGLINYWDFKWNLTCYAQNGLCVVPERNLMSNIGFGEDSTHTRTAGPIFNGLKTQPLTFPLRHPLYLYADSEPERGLARKIHESLPVKSRMAQLLRRTPALFSCFRDMIQF